MKNISPYPTATWRLLITPPLDGATNMAIDEAMLTELGRGSGQPTLRFYQWQPACLSLGYAQSWTEVNEAACQRLGYTWTRRATGGKAILHTDELTYSLIIPRHDPRIVGGILSSYQVLSYGLLSGLQKLGVSVEQADKREPHPREERQGAVCFDTPARYEILWQGKKLIGSAQLRRTQGEGVVLQHGTLPLHGNLKRILEVLHFSDEQRAWQESFLLQKATTLEQVLADIVPFAKVAAALTVGFAEQLNLEFVEMALTESEQALAEQLRIEHYANDSWNKRL